MNTLATRSCFTRMLPCTRSFYTYNTPKDTRRIIMDDGSCLIFLKPSTSSVSSSVSSDASSSTSSQKLVNNKVTSAYHDQIPAEIEASLPPRLRNYPQQATPSKEQILQMQQLRESDPDTWTVQQLARKFNTYPGFVLKVTHCPPQRAQMLRDLEQSRFDHLSIQAKIKAINRLRRKQLW